MFVVITLVAAQERARPDMRDGVEAFSSPTVVHFCAALLVSAILAAPWHRLVGTGILLALTGLYGVAYAARVLRRIMRMRSAYVPGFDDWFWYAIMPLAAYATIFAAGIVLPAFPRPTLFALAGGAILLVFIGIRNAWDTVTFIAVNVADGKPPQE